MRSIKTNTNRYASCAAAARCHSANSEKINSHIVGKQNVLVFEAQLIARALIHTATQVVLVYFEAGLCNNYVNPFRLVYVYFRSDLTAL